MLVLLRVGLGLLATRGSAAALLLEELGGLLAFEVDGRLKVLVDDVEAPLQLAGEDDGGDVPVQLVGVCGYASGPARKIQRAYLVPSSMILKCTSRKRSFRCGFLFAASASSSLT